MSFRYTNILSLLNDEGVHYVVIGGIAGALHGCTCHTQDLDICCDFSPENLLRLQKAMAEFHPIHRMTPSKKPLALNEQNCQGLKNLYLDTDLGQLDCLSVVQGIGDFEDVKKQSEPMKFHKGFINVLTIDAILKAKKSLHREHDREAIRQLEIIRNHKKKLTNNSQ